jgi:hypothetical protein
MHDENYHATVTLNIFTDLIKLKYVFVRLELKMYVYFIYINSMFQVMLSVHFQHAQRETCVRMSTGCRGGRIMAITRVVIVTFSCFLLLYSKEGKLRSQDGTHYFRSLHIRNVPAAQRHKTNNAVTKTVRCLRMRGTKQTLHHEDIGSSVLFTVI